MEYFGLFKQLKDLDMPNSFSNSAYEGIFARFYDVISQDENYDLEVIDEQMKIKGKKSSVLELACGSGRILKYVADNNMDIEGIELSQDMITLFNERMMRFPQEFYSRIKIHKGDMRNFNLNKKFDIIILTATSICLLDNEEDLKCLFNCVYEHLNEGGRFIFDFINLKEESNNYFRSGEINCLTFNYNRFKQFVLLGEQVNNNENSSLMNLYTEVTKDDETYRYFSMCKKSFFCKETFLDLIDQFNLKIIEEKKIKLPKIESSFLIVEKV